MVKSRFARSGPPERLPLGVRVLGLLAALLARFADHSRQAAGVATRTDRRAAVDSGRAHGLDRAGLVGPGVGLLPGAAWAESFGDAIAVGFRAPGAHDDLVVRGARAG